MPHFIFSFIPSVLFPFSLLCFALLKKKIRIIVLTINAKAYKILIYDAYK